MKYKFVYIIRLFIIFATLIGVLDRIILQLLCDIVENVNYNLTNICNNYKFQTQKQNMTLYCNLQS